MHQGDSKQYQLGVDPKILRHNFMTGSEVRETVAMSRTDMRTEGSVVSFVRSSMKLELIRVFHSNIKLRWGDVRWFVRWLWLGCGG